MLEFLSEYYIIVIYDVGLFISLLWIAFILSKPDHSRTDRDVIQALAVAIMWPVSLTIITLVRGMHLLVDFFVWFREFSLAPVHFKKYETRCTQFNDDEEIETIDLDNEKTVDAPGEDK